MNASRLMLLLAFAAAAIAAVAAANPDCTCPHARISHGWCRPCGVGYVASVPLRSADLYEAVHPHPHEVSRAHVRCATCLAALEADGFCETCRIGYVDGEAYVSRLTYLLALGEPRDPASIECVTCRRLATRAHRAAPGALEPGGWCDRCDVGRAGHVAFTDRARLRAAVTELGRLRRAIETSRRCELCGVALFLDALCPTCGIRYRGGVPQRPGPGPGGER